MINIDSLSVDDEIKKELKELSDSINIDQHCTKGSNGHLFFGYNKVLEKKVALKFYYWGGNKKYHAEPRLLADIKSKYVIEVLHAKILDNDWTLFITPYYSGGDLDDLISNTKISLHRAISFTMNVLCGLSELHAHRLVHRDLKPQNILINKDKIALIADFGSVKLVPEGESSIPGSGHSVLYRPPESCASGIYGQTGDIYQCGILLFQLLGGLLPYDEVSWLTSQQLKEYNTIEDPVNRSIFVDNVIKNRIKNGKLLNMKSLPLWVSKSLRRVINKATNIKPDNRYTNTCEIIANLHSILSKTHDWKLENGIVSMCCNNGKRYKIERARLTNKYRILKNIGNGWRKDRRFSENEYSEQINSLLKIPV